MKAKLLFMLIVSIIGLRTMRADEGMWVPLLLHKYTIDDMQKKGFKLTAEDIYSINKASLKDAVMIFGGGCTAELISEQGLIITNHHCGYGAIQHHSSLEHDYLTNGFYAPKMGDELENQNLTVTFLVRMEDVTDKVMAVIDPKMTENQRNSAINKLIADLSMAASEEGKYNVAIKPFFNGNQYFMFIQKVYRDVRLVLAPPSAIGKFGGDTDNWMWPRHTGDFSVFRIYADNNNEPSEFNVENKPYKPIKSFEVSTKGIKEGDFTMVFGYPGRTQQYLTSFAVRMISEIQNPVRIDLRQNRIDIMSKYMNESDLIRIQYAAKYARVSNAWKKWIGENRGLKRLNAIEKKEELEKEFEKWANSKQVKKKYDYVGILNEYKQLYTELSPINLTLDYIFEAAFAVEIINLSRSFTALLDATGENALLGAKKRLNAAADAFFKDYNADIDKETFAAVFAPYALNAPTEYRPDVLNVLNTEFGGDAMQWAKYVFDKTIFSKKDELIKFVEEFDGSEQKIQMLVSDPAFEIMESVVNIYNDKIRIKQMALEAKEDSLDRIWMQALMNFQTDRNFYPDANSTLRVSYGKIESAYPYNGVKYLFQTTLEGYMEKDNPEIYDYRVPEKLKELYLAKDYGKWGENGQMPVAFIATNHTTGGNSGSPVLNANGQLIGVNFDRSWESTMSDIMFDPGQCRNISLDIRFALFIMEKYFGAERLINEINFAKE